jgi:putative Mg2+ transporter-C (MgtC) family protein
MPVGQQIYGMLRAEMASIVGLSIARLVLAAILGGLIGLERELKHKPAGVRTNLFICMGAALFTILSDQLAGQHGGDHTRIAAQIIPGIGFIGAGSILHARGELITGLTTAATIFVVASVGMAVGGGLYLTSIFATAVILLCLFLLGHAEESLNLKLAFHSYEVTGRNADEISLEVNRILESIHGITQNVRIAATPQHVRFQFDLKGTHKDQARLLVGLKQSTTLQSVVSLGPVQTE